MTLLVALTSALLLGTTALADPEESSTARQLAKEHFDRATAFKEAGEYDRAVSELRAAHAILPLPELLFNIAQNLRLKGDRPAAVEAYGQYLTAAPAGPLADKARQFIESLRREAAAPPGREPAPLERDLGVAPGAPIQPDGGVPPPAVSPGIPPRLAGVAAHAIPAPPPRRRPWLWGVVAAAAAVVIGGAAITAVAATTPRNGPIPATDFGDARIRF